MKTTAVPEQIKLSLSLEEIDTLGVTEGDIDNVTSSDTIEPEHALAVPVTVIVKVTVPAVISAALGV